jgi:hypothetical protein
MTGMHHYAQLLVKMGSCKLFAQAVLELKITPSSSSSQVARITDVSY